VIRGRLVFAALLVILQACSSNTREEAKLSDITGGTPPPSMPPAENQMMKAAEIMHVLSNKSFQYTRSGSGSGVITFSSDGTFVYQENGKGEGTGVWQASEGELCEAFNPTSFLPKGSRSECRPFRWDGNAYFAGDARFQPS
jgi:hypothetical protein